IGGHRAQVRVTVPLSVLLPAAELERPDHPPGQPPGTAPPVAGAPPPGEAPAEDLIPCLGLPPSEVAELEGYGPLTPDIARALAAGNPWRRLLTDPLTGAILDVGRTRYQPPAALAEYVRERDQTCTRPGCTTPARSCDLDHTIPWSHD